MQSGCTSETFERDFEDLSDEQQKSDHNQIKIEQDNEDIDLSDEEENGLLQELQLDPLSDKELKNVVKVIRRKIQQQDDIFDYNNYTSQILNYCDSDTGTYMIHYACEFGNQSFLSQIKSYHSQAFIEN